MGTNHVLLDPDVRKAFRSERAVNDAFDLVIQLRKVGSYKRRDYSSNGVCGCENNSPPRLRRGLGGGG